MDNRPIGIFDSGLGGIKILSTLKEALPNESFIFVADEAYLPYGTKTKEQLIDRINKICTYLKKQDCKAIVIACNTASTLYDDIKDNYDIRIFDVINPMVLEVEKQTKNKKVLVLGTTFTINSGLYHQKLKEKGIDIIGIPCPSFITLVESGQINTKQSFDEVNKHLNDVKNESFDTCVYGCTHFGYLDKEIHSAINHDFLGLDCGMPVCMMLKDYLEKENKEANNPSTITLNTTGDLKNFIDKLANVSFKYHFINKIDL